MIKPETHEVFETFDRLLHADGNLAELGDKVTAAAEHAAADPEAVEEAQAASEEITLAAEAKADDASTDEPKGRGTVLFEKAAEKAAEDFGSMIGKGAAAVILGGVGWATGVLPSIIERLINLF